MEGSHAAQGEAVSFARIVSFTDGVYAIAITLLVLNFEIPHVANETGRQLAHFVAQLAGDFGVYFLTFAVLGRMWIVHHRLFSMLETFDARLITLNLAYLSMIVLVPFTAELLGDYADESLPAILYAAVLAVASGLNWVMARHAARADLLHPERRETVAPYAAAAALYIPGVFLASIPVALASPLAAEAMWTLLIVGRVLHARSGGRRQPG